MSNGSRLAPHGRSDLNLIVVLPSTLRLPYNESKPPWERTEAVTTCTTLRTIELNLLGPKGQALDDASRELGIGWTDWCFVVEEDSEEPDVSGMSSAFVQHRVNQILTAFHAQHPPKESLPFCMWAPPA